MDSFQLDLVDRSALLLRGARINPALCRQIDGLLTEELGDSLDLWQINCLAYAGARTIWGMMRPTPGVKRQRHPLEKRKCRLQSLVKDAKKKLGRLHSERTRRDWTLPPTSRQRWIQRQLRLRGLTGQQLNCTVERQREMVKVKQFQLKEAEKLLKQHRQREQFAAGGPKRALSNDKQESTITPDLSDTQDFWGNLLGVEDEFNKLHPGIVKWRQPLKEIDRLASPSLILNYGRVC